MRAEGCRDLPSHQEFPRLDSSNHKVRDTFSSILRQNECRSRGSTEEASQSLRSLTSDGDRGFQFQLHKSTTGGLTTLWCGAALDWSLGARLWTLAQLLSIKGRSSPSTFIPNSTTPSRTFMHVTDPLAMAKIQTTKIKERLPLILPRKSSQRVTKPTAGLASRNRLIDPSIPLNTDAAANIEFIKQHLSLKKKIVVVSGAGISVKAGSKILTTLDGIALSDLISS